MNSKSNTKIRVISGQTLGYYNGKSEQFWQGTKDHDVTQNIEALLNSIQSEGPFHILDFGCGPGRDLVSFTKLGHKATGLDGCEKFVAMAKENSKCDVLHQNFIDLSLSENTYDGIFANASLFHVPASELERVLNELSKSLKPGGILFTSNPRGDGEGWSGDRWCHYMEIEVYKSFLDKANFEVVDHYYRPDSKPMEERPWLATVAKKL